MNAYSIIGLIILLMVWWDSFITVFSMDGAGLITHSWTRVLWRGLLGIHRRFQIHHVLSLAGPAMLFSTILLWYFAHSIAWTLIFVSHPGSVIDNTTGEAATVSQMLYMVGTTLSSLGYGDYVPSGPPWTFLSNFSCLSATVILTVSLSYVLAVLAAALQKQVFAQSVFGLGGDIETVVRSACLGNSRLSLKNYLLKLSSDLDDHAHKHLAYPVLRYFHSPRSDNSVARAVLLLSDTFFVLHQVQDVDQRPPEGLIRLMESSIEHFLEMTDKDVDVALDGGSVTRPLVLPAQKLGVSVDDPKFSDALSDYQERRRNILLQCHQDGWHFE